MSTSCQFEQTFLDRLLHRTRESHIYREDKKEKLREWSERVWPCPFTSHYKDMAVYCTCVRCGKQIIYEETFRA